MTVRLNKLLATRGVAARRKCDELIAAGHVTVNGEVVLTPGTRVEPDRDHVKVNGKRIPGAPSHKYFVLNKPVGVISTMSDPEGRRSLKDVLPRGGSRLFPVGRLDADTSGLLLLTNDGDLAHKLMHPRYGVEKFYRVIVSRTPMPYQVERLRRGVTFEKGVRSSPARVRVRTPVSRGSVVEIVLSEGRYRQVRRMCEAVGLDVIALHRWGYGPVRLGELARGMWRELSEADVASLRAAASRPKATSEMPFPGRKSGAARPRLRPRLKQSREVSTTRPSATSGRPGRERAGVKERGTRRSQRLRKDREEVRGRGTGRSERPRTDRAEVRGRGTGRSARAKPERRGSSTRAGGRGPARPKRSGAAARSRAKGRSSRAAPRRGAGRAGASGRPKGSGQRRGRRGPTSRSRR